MIDPQQAVEAVKTIAKESHLAELGVGGIFAVILIDRVLAWALKFRGKGNGKTNGLNPGYVAQVQNHMADAIEANSRIESIDKNTDELCKCMVVLANNQAQQTTILSKISDNQIRMASKISFDKDPNRY
jgi:hypothetical protein